MTSDFFSRRDFLRASAAIGGATLIPGGALHAAVNREIALRSAEAEIALGLDDSGVKTRVWAYNNAFPGQLLRFKKNERVRIVVENALPVSTAVHWHGMRVPNDMDGVPFVTQAPIKAGERFTYEFTIQDSGTYWYHPHQNSHEQVARGLYGPLIVEEDKPINVDRDLTWVLSDLKLTPQRQQVEDFGRIRDLANDGRLGNVALINGQPAGEKHAFAVRSGERLRLRLINAASARIFNLVLEGHTTTVIARDGQAVQPYPLETINLGPGMRVDLVIDCMQKPGSVFVMRDAGVRGMGEMTRFAYRQDKPLRNRAMSSPIKLAANAIPEPDLAKAADHYIVFQGGMRGAPVIGTVDGKPSNIHEIMERNGLAWTMNFTAQHEHALMHEPLLYLKKGQHVMLHLINETDFAHPMHLHGHFFRVVALNGQKLRNPEWRDTVMMAPRESIDVAFVASALGEWMFHCHILDHAAGGMMGTIAVED
jgi:FtsP/CotA-like multicopper oxidase with cupredoxin domain